MTAATQEEPFKDALARFASGVVIATAVDASGRWHGFTASAFTALSLDPPLVLVCLARSADCHEPFIGASAYGISLLREEHIDLARRFATKGADKFAGQSFTSSRLGPPLVRDALASFACRAHERISGGDHTVLIGEVVETQIADGRPMLFYRRQFRGVGPVAGRSSAS